MLYVIGRIDLSPSERLQADRLSGETTTIRGFALGRGRVDDPERVVPTLKQLRRTREKISGTQGTRQEFFLNSKKSNSFSLWTKFSDVADNNSNFSE